MHHRLAPKVHSFHYNVFMFYLDLDEIDMLHSKLKLMSRNRFNVFNFKDSDHLQLPMEKPDMSKNVREHLVSYLKGNCVDIGNGRIMVLTNLSTLGYQFNPVSFYFCYDEGGALVCSVVEVCNTFREMKPYFLGANTRVGDTFKMNMTKYFYVSPFIDMDTHFDFDLKEPGEKMELRIDDYDKNGKLFFISTLIGERKPLTDSRLLLYFISFPLITVKVIGLIHWQAFKLWLKKLPYHKKTDRVDLQQGVYKAYQSK